MIRYSCTLFYFVFVLLILPRKVSPKFHLKGQGFNEVKSNRSSTYAIHTFLFSCVHWFKIITYFCFVFLFRINFTFIRYIRSFDKNRYFVILFGYPKMALTSQFSGIRNNAKKSMTRSHIRSSQRYFTKKLSTKSQS